MPTKNFKTGVAVVVALAVVGLFFLYGNIARMISGDAQPGAASAPAEQAQLVVQDERVGTGASATVGKTLTVHYTGRFDDGRVFDTSVGKDPIAFTLGAGDVIPGWDQGLQGMQVGGKRLLIIPSSLGYGPADYGPIPGNSTLIFEVELLKVE